jgi:hypothetical protein
VFRNMVIFCGEELLAPPPTPKLENHPLSAVRDSLFNVFAATLHMRRPFLHPQPEDAPCRGDRETLVMEKKALTKLCKFHIVDTVHLRHIKLRYKPTDAH